MYNTNLSKLLKIIIPIVIIVVIGGGIFIWYNNFYNVDKNISAQNESFMAVRYFEEKEWDKALNGDGNYPGFINILDSYKGTDMANMARYYISIIYINKGEYGNAIKNLSLYKAKDEVTKITSIGLLGDANVELKNYEEAITKYNEAISIAKNKEGKLASIYLIKLGLTYEAVNKNKEALDVYKEVKNLYINLPVGDIEKYIGRVEAKL